MTEPNLRALLKTHFGYDDFRPLQQDIIEHALSRRDSLVLMATGGGKSLCYQLPALIFDGIAIVVSPLIALMKDQVDALTANGIPAAYINSLLSPNEVYDVERAAQSGRLKILYVAPERLALVGFQNFLRTLEISLIAIDEAHCISEWGHEFRPDYRNLRALRRQFPSTPVIALTATATETVREDILAQLELQGGRVFASSFNRENLEYTVMPKRDSFASLVALLERRRDQPAIVYCFSRKDTENLASSLNASGLNAMPYHAGLEPRVRQDAQDNFIRDRTPIIVATIAFGMGIDKPDIRVVAHYDLPKSVEAYYQETGRAGRDGLPSECVLFYSYADKRKQEFFIDQMENAAERENARQKLERMVDFCETRSCRRHHLLEYFGEEYGADECGGCDVCLTPRDEFDATIIAQKVLSAVIRTGERFGMNHVIGVLRGSKSRRVIDLGHDRLSVYGIVDDYGVDTLREIVRMLVSERLLQRNEGEFPTLAVSGRGREWLKRRESLTLPKPRAAAPPPTSADPSTEEYDESLFQNLRALRSDIAERRGVPPYVVFGDRALQQMAARLPQSADDFLAISGVGPAKLEQYGERFMGVIRERAERLGIEPTPTRAPTRTTVDAAPAPRAPGATCYATKNLLDQGLSIAGIAERRGLRETSVLGHLERLAGAGDALDLSGVLPPTQRMEAIRDAFSECGDSFLAPVKRKLGDGFSYEEIRLARIHLRQTRESEKRAES